MRDRILQFAGCFSDMTFRGVRHLLSKSLFITGLFILISLAGSSALFAQSEDTTETRREAPEVNPEQTQENPVTPYNSDILQSDIERYKLRDYGSSSRFYRQLKYLTAEDFMMREEEGYQRYGEEWVNKINADLLKIARATFKEDSEIMKLWKSIAPFLSFGIWEQYEVPITRVDYRNKVPVEEK